MLIRRIEERDNKAVAAIVRQCLAEYGCAGRMDTAWGDPCLDSLSQVYVSERNGYWVAEDDDGTVVAGVGIGILEGESDICELQKMYCISEFRGTGVAQSLLDTALDFAGRFYKMCYLETLENMERAQSFYKRNGFYKTSETYGNTGHGGCDWHFIKKLN